MIMIIMIYPPNSLPLTNCSHSTLVQQRSCTSLMMFNEDNRRGYNEFEYGSSEVPFEEKKAMFDSASREKK